MALRVAISCFAVFALAPCCGGVTSGAKAKATMKDPWDVPDASEELESPMVEGGDGSAPAAEEDDNMEQSPADMAAVIGQYEARHAMAQANSQHAVMKQFMKNFARNMRLSVLRDSRGDMPEEERQRLIAKAEDDARSGGGDVEDGAIEAEDTQLPRQPLPRRPHMLNMAETRPSPRYSHRPRHKLLPEAEGIGFPPPPGMAPDPAMMASEAPAYDMPVPRPHPHRHHSRMLNVRPDDHAEPEQQIRQHRSHELPPNVVRDDMGRVMPVLFAVPTKSDSHGRSVNSIALMCCLVMLRFSLG
mmetsp:Transcript_102653/g.162211  ORF Transcript_102653/g.162211 Transcript_102653/m.162211 type:complete len:301 (-) Transcript_102653:22-924(-)